MEYHAASDWGQPKHALKSLKHQILLHLLCESIKRCSAPVIAAHSLFVNFPCCQKKSTKCKHTSSSLPKRRGKETNTKGSKHACHQTGRADVANAGDPQRIPPTRSQGRRQAKKRKPTTGLHKQPPNPTSYCAPTRFCATSNTRQREVGTVGFLRHTKWPLENPYYSPPNSLPQIKKLLQFARSIP